MGTLAFIPTSIKYTTMRSSAIGAPLEIRVGDYSYRNVIRCHADKVLMVVSCQLARISAFPSRFLMLYIFSSLLPSFRGWKSQDLKLMKRTKGMLNM